MSDNGFVGSDVSRSTSDIETYWNREDPRPGANTKRDQWIRKVNLTVYDAKGQNPGQGIDISALRINFTVTKMTNASPNLLTARVYNLSPKTMQQVKNYRRVILSAGYKNGNFGVIFDGTVVLYVQGKENTVDTYLEIFAGDLDSGLNNTVVNLTWPAGTTPTQKAKDAIQKMGIKVEVPQEAKNEPKTLRSSSYCGMARDCIRDQMNAIDADFYVEDGVGYIVLRLNGYRQGELVHLSPTTGLIGMPKVTPSGIEAMCLLNPKLRLGTLFEIKTSLLSNVPFEPGNPGAPFATGERGTTFAATGGQQFNFAGVSGIGRYKILQLVHYGDTRENPWYSSIVGVGINSDGSLSKYPGSAFGRSLAFLGPGGTPAAAAPSGGG
jgi:hypothetical protein